jgi:hypothetical protein
VSGAMADFPWSGFGQGYAAIGGRRPIENRDGSTKYR